MHSHPMLIADASGVIVFWNTAAEQVFGHAAGSAIGRTLDLIVPADYREAHWRGFQAAIRSGVAAVEGQSTPFPAQCSDGQVVERAGRLTLLRAPDASVIGALVVFD